jgi:hypothetical protein
LQHGSLLLSFCDVSEEESGERVGVAAPRDVLLPLERELGIEVGEAERPEAPQSQHGDAKH